MAVISFSFGIRSTGRFVTTTAFALSALFGMLSAAFEARAIQPWDPDQFQSVVVESALPHDGTGIAPNGRDVLEQDVGLSGDSEVVADNFTTAFAGDDACVQCTGAGCTQCGQTTLFDLIGSHCRNKDACWIGRADALILWRNAPPGGAIVDNPAIPGHALSAGGMDSPAAGGPRFSIFRVNKCTGNAIEATYLRAANFRSLRPLSVLPTLYDLPAPGIYGNQGLTFDTAEANLGARLQSFEFNRHRCINSCVRFLAGFRWVEWQEQFSMQANSLGGVSDNFQTNCMNDLYGGQIGLDANLLAMRWIKFDSVVKAGAYYNNAVQSSLYTTNDSANPGTAAVTVGQSPLSGAFVGEVGLTGVVPLTSYLDVRFGYFGLWLSGIAQPTQQLTRQQLTPGQPTVGTINSNGGSLVQGATIGLEARF